VDGSTNRGGDIYLRNLDSAGAAPIWLRRLTCQWLVGAFPASPCTFGAPYYCFNYALSGNGLSVAYQANAGPGTSNVLLYGQSGANAIRIATDSDLVGRPQISSQGDWVAFSSRSNIYLWNRATGSNTLISVSTNGGPANGPSHSPVMSADPNARFIAFVSKASDLAPNGTSNRYQIYLHDRFAGTNRLVTVNTNGTASDGDFELANAAVPPEGGALVAFDSTASDLVANDLNGASDIFIRDLNMNQTRLISRAHASLPSRTASPMSGTSANSISADGRIVAFTSYDTPLVPDDTNTFQDVFVRNLNLGSLVRLSGPQVLSYSPQAALDPVISAAGNHAVYNIFHGPSGPGRYLFWYDLALRSNVLVSSLSWPVTRSSVSANGDLVVFESGNDICARHMPEGETNLVSANYTGTRGGNGPSSNAVLSPDARWVAFESSATDLLPANVTGGIRSLFARDLLSNATEVVSVGSDGNAQWGSRGRAAFSGNSRFVVLVGDNYPVLRRDLQLKTSSLVASQGDNPSLNFDGRFVAYEIIANFPKQIYVTDMQSGIAKLVSANVSGVPGNGPSTAPQITSDGRFIVFQSLASDLVQNDNNNASDIFLGDRILGTVVLLTINSSGSGSANGASSMATLSADGHTVVFQSLANDLIRGDYNDRRDVFVARLSMPDSDGDGLDDDFEITHFGDLSHDGTADSDGDSQTDYQEFLAGTNPTSNSSILRAITVGNANSNAKQVIWSAVPGRSYIVQYKDSLAASWSTLMGTVRASASTAAKLDMTSAPQRFYRVLLAE
ncbi:MAG TPA: hypothetical protein VK615_04875, partial [Candidatus Binatia bacterium]|nr:hypothetical protein [Candidatus Binatia bacterium]